MNRYYYSLGEETAGDGTKALPKQDAAKSAMNRHAHARKRAAHPSARPAPERSVAISSPAPTLPPVAPASETKGWLIIGAVVLGVGGLVWIMRESDRDRGRP